MPTQNKPPCKHYDPWNTKSPGLNMRECFNFIPYSGRCDCGRCEFYNQACPWLGYPGEDLCALGR